MQSHTAAHLIRLNHELLTLAKEARAESQRVRSASFDARIQRIFSINRPAPWADMMVAWVFARSQATTLPLSLLSTLERERALCLWRCRSPSVRPRAPDG